MSEQAPRVPTQEEAHQSVENLAAFVYWRAANCAKFIAKPHVVEGGSGMSFEAGGETHQLSANVPDHVRNAAAFFRCVSDLVDGKENQDLDRIEASAFLMGYYAAEAVFAAQCKATLREAADTISSMKAGRRKGGENRAALRDGELRNEALRAIEECLITSPNATQAYKRAAEKLADKRTIVSPRTLERLHKKSLSDE